MLARVKLKGIDGGPHKRWSMWFNSMIREILEWCRDAPAACSRYTGVAWLSSARAVKCEIKFFNERNPYCLLLTGRAEDSDRTAGDKSEEGGDDVKSSWPLCPGPHTCYNGRYRAKRNCEVEQIAKSRSQYGLYSATRVHEVGIASNRISA